MKIYEDLRSLQLRLGIVQSVVLGLVVLLAAQFWHLQVLRGRSFRELAENNRVRAVRLAAPRGSLLDRNGKVVVENRAAFNVLLTPEHAEDLPATIARLAELLQVPEADIRSRLQRREGRFRPVVVKADASIDDVTAIEARRFELPETGVEVVPLRSYPLADAAAQLLGRVGEVTDRQLQLPSFKERAVAQGAVVGQAGVESQYNGELMGVDGVRRVVVNSRGIEVAAAGLEPPVEGPPLTLTLDVELQRAVEAAMAGRAGGVVALDPDTGEVLAMTSTPAYDPNAFAAGIDASEWLRLNADARTPLLNRAIQGQYAPGSTFKVPMAVAALEEKVITPETTFYCPGYLAIYGTVFRCHKEEGHGSVNLRKALAQSCNVFFYNVGVKLEIERISRYAKLMGLSAPTGIDLPGEVSGLVQDREWKLRTQREDWYRGETVSVAIGQAMTVTAVQMARLAAVMVNGGRLVKPHVVRAVAGRPVELPPPTDLHLSPHTLQLVKDAMMAVVEEGTGSRARVPGITVGGKTGSAQVVTHARLESDKKRHEYQPHGWFMSFATDGRRKIAMAVLVEHGVGGGVSAAPVTGQILHRWFGIPGGPVTPPLVPEPLFLPPGRLAE
jgi:penicillin-binding protein 2